MLGALPFTPATVVAGSNGCSVAARLALEDPDRVARLVLAWPATAGDPKVDAWARRQGVPEQMLAGETLRGLTDAELAALSLPVAVLPSPRSPFHQRSTVDGLLRLVPGAVELPGSPEPPRPEFVPDDLVSALLAWHAQGGDHSQHPGPGLDPLSARGPGAHHRRPE